MVFLAHLGHGLAFAILDDLFSEPEPTCWCVVWQLRRLFQVKLLKPYVQWPDAAERDRIAAWFNIYANMPGCIGMINDLLFSCLCAPPYILPFTGVFVRSPRLSSHLPIHRFAIGGGDIAVIRGRLQCKMGFRQYKDPKMPCLHGVCGGECVRTLWARKPRNCPHCDTPIAPDVDAKTLPEDFVSATMLHALQCRAGDAATLQCAECDADEKLEVAGCCKDCDAFLCTVHFAGHRMGKTPKHHSVSWRSWMKCANPQRPCHAAFACAPSTTRNVMSSASRASRASACNAPYSSTMATTNAHPPTP